MKITMNIAAAMIAGLAMTAGATDLNGLRAADVAEISAPALPEPSAEVSKAWQAETGDRTARMSSKIMVTPVTANWKNAMLVKFTKGTGLDEARYVLNRAGLSSEEFFDNGDGYLVRVEIMDVDVPLRAHRLAGFPAVESVRVNRAVYARMAAGLA